MTRPRIVFLEVECPDEYEDVHPEIVFSDFLSNPGAWKVSLVDSHPLIEALRFYGEPSHWKVSRQTPDRPVYEFIEDDRAGLIARTALKDFEGVGE